MSTLHHTLRVVIQSSQKDSYTLYTCSLARHDNKAKPYTYSIVSTQDHTTQDALKSLAQNASTLARFLEQPLTSFEIDLEENERTLFERYYTASHKTHNPHHDRIEIHVQTYQKGSKHTREHHPTFFSIFLYPKKIGSLPELTVFHKESNAESYENTLEMLASALHDLQNLCQPHPDDIFYHLHPNDKHKVLDCLDKKNKNRRN